MQLHWKDNKNSHYQRVNFLCCVFSPFCRFPNTISELYPVVPVTLDFSAVWKDKYYADPLPVSLSDTWTPQIFPLLFNQEPHSFLQIMTKILYFQFTGRGRSDPDTLPLIKCSLRKNRQNWEFFAFCGIADGRSESSVGFSHAHALSGQEDKDSIPVHLSMDANSRWVFAVDL